MTTAFWYDKLLLLISNLLKVYDFNINFNGSAWISELHSVWKKVVKNLRNSLFVTVNPLNGFKVNVLVNKRFELNIVFESTVTNHLQRFFDNLWEIEIVLVQVKLLIFIFGKVQQIIYKVFHHFLWKLLSFQKIFALRWNFMNDYQLVLKVSCLGFRLFKQVFMCHNYRIVLFLNFFEFTFDLINKFMRF